MVAVCLIISLIYGIVPLFTNCKGIPDEAINSDLEMSSWGCSSVKEYNPLATLFFGGEEGAMKQMLGETAQFVKWDFAVLFAFLLIYYSLSIFSLGLAIPLGTFIPQVVSGAVLGRIMGEVVKLAVDNSLISGPGAYAFVGASAMLAGFTRMTVAVMVILIEASGAIGLSVPMMMSIIFARSLADRLVAPYDEQMLDLKGYEFVHNEPATGTELLIAEDILTTCPTLGEVVTRSDAKEALESCPEQLDAIPICGNGGHALGLVAKTTLSEKLLVDKRINVRKHRRKRGLPSPKRSIIEMLGMKSRSNSQASQNGNGCVDECLNNYSEEVPNDVSDDDEGYDTKKIDLSAIIDRDPYTVPVYAPIARVYRMFRRMDLRHLIVVDEKNNVEGLISRHNLLAHRTKAEIEKLAASHHSECSDRGENYDGCGYLYNNQTPNNDNDA